MDIKDRKDIEHLVNSFYVKIRAHYLLGPIFNRAISDWPHHLSHLSDFWETNLFAVPKFKGRPPLVHAEVDKQEGYSITQQHFDEWLLLWNATVDELFQGETANRAKQHAAGIAVILLSRIIYMRPKGEG